MMSGRIRSLTFRTLVAASPFAFCALLACSGTATIDFEGEGGTSASGGNTSTSTSSANGGQGAGGSTQTSSGGGNPICDCDAAYRPVCGVDGETYDGACGDECVPVEVACPGECPCLSCEEIASAYRQIVQKLKGCDASIDVEQCTEQVQSGLICGCPTFINPSDPEAVAELQALAQRYDDMECEPLVQCEACPPEPIRGSCQSDSTGNTRVDTCVDVYP